MNLVRTFDAESEVISLTDVKNQLRITTTADDDSFREFIAATRHRAEQFLGKTLITSTWEYKLDCFTRSNRIYPTANQIMLPMGPIQSISSITYIDADGVSQTLSSANYQFDRRGRLKPAFGTTWPSTRDQYDAVTITYVAGETSAGNVAPDIRHALLLMVGAADIGREDIFIGAGVLAAKIPDHAERLLAPHKDWAI